MDTKRVVDILILVAAVAGAVYYAVAVRETRGVIIVLLAILYFTAYSSVVKDESGPR